ncbi:AAA family ATPase [Amycolatopsis sp. NBC_01307]|uniref:AAA family ATPase n=1 Tax=Amycolatopsis sp. NBC_01307 TaxID=2903561 RepID=UPI002E13C25D|nr:AAA family ATPase [Amycolatopsis sp. NBC_01307]
MPGPGRAEPAMADALVRPVAAPAVRDRPAGGDGPAAPSVLTLPWRGEFERRARRAGNVRLVEREDEIAVLRRGIRGAVAGRSGRVVVVGPRGAGSSALLAAAVREARVAGMITAFARCTPAESTVHRGVINQLSADIAGAGCRLDSGTRTCGRTQTERTIPTLCGDFVGVASQGPLLIAVDDSQWSDPGSRAWLEAMEHRLQQAPILLVRAVMQAGHRPLAVRADGVDTVVVRPLTEDGLRQLVADRFPGTRPDARFAAGLHLATGGKPALVAPVLERLSAAGLEPVAERLPAVIAHLADLRDADLAVSIAALPADALHLLRAIAICRGLLDFELVTTLAGPLTGSAEVALRMLSGFGLVFGGAEPKVADDVTADAALGTLNSAERAALATRAAELAYRAAVPDDQLAELLTTIRPIGTTWAVATLRRAAEQRRAVGDRHGAARLLTRALREPVSQAERRKLMLGLALAEVADQPELSDLRLQRVLLDAGPEVSGAVLLDAADHLLSRGDTRTAHRAIAATWRRRSAFDAGTSALAALGWLAQEDSVAGPVVPTPVFGAPAAQPGPPDAARAATIASELAGRGREFDRARELARLALAPRSGKLPSSLRIQASWVLFCTDDLTEAVLGLTDVLQDATRVGARAAAANALLMRARCELRRGNLGQAEADIEAAETRLPEAAWHPRSVSRLLAVRAEFALAGLRLDEAEKAVADPLPAGAEDGMAAAYFLVQRGAVRLAGGEPAAALEDFRAAGRGTRARREGNPVDLPWRTGVAIALARLGEPAAAAEIAREALARAETWGASSGRGTANLYLAEVFGGAETRARLEAAVALLEGSPLRVQFLTAVTDLAGACLDDGDPVEAAALLGRVSTIRPLLLPAGLVAKIRDVTGRLTRSTGTAAVEPVAGDPVGSLSEEEASIAALAAAGHSNSEIARSLRLSGRLVELRLTRIYRKLTVTGRRQLTELMSPDSAAS